MKDNKNNDIPKKKDNVSLAIILAGIIISISLLVSVSIFRIDGSYIVGSSPNASVNNIICDPNNLTQCAYVNGGVSTNSDSFYTRVGLGKIPGFENVIVAGYNDDVTSSEETVWNVGGLYVFPENASILTISSTSASDTVGGIGARVILIGGLDANWNEISEFVNLSGTTPVATINSFLRVNSMIVFEAGSQNSAVGVINAVHPESTLARIDSTDNTEQQTVYSVPANHTAYFVNSLQNSGKGDELELFYRATPPPINVNLLASKIRMYQNSLVYGVKMPLAFPEKTDFNVNCKDLSGGVSATSVLLEFLVVENNALDQYPNLQ